MMAANQFAARNIGVINGYVSEHSYEGGTPWLDSANDPPRVVIGFTANVAAHRRALAAVLGDPQRVLVCQIPHSAAEVAAIAAEVQHAHMTSNADGSLSVSQSPDGVSIDLRADKQPLAADLVAKYGDIVSITLGIYPYPLPTAGVSTHAACAHNLTGPTDMNGLHAKLTLTGATVHSGTDIAGVVTITNTRNEPVALTSGSPLVGKVVQPGTVTVVAVYTGVIGGVGYEATLQPGESHALGVVAGTANCDPTTGYSLPPGQYEVLVPVVMSYTKAPGEPTVNLLVSSPATLNVIP